jgi:hypothetical protein
VTGTENGMAVLDSSALCAGNPRGIATGMPALLFMRRSAAALLAAFLLAQ